MDPKAALDSAERALKRKDYYTAGEYLDNYWEWRRRGGFEPKGGDKRASKLGEKLSEEWEGGESGWGDAGGVEGEGYENPKKRKSKKKASRKKNPKSPGKRATNVRSLVAKALK